MTDWNITCGRMAEIALEGEGLGKFGNPLQRAELVIAGRHADAAERQATAAERQAEALEDILLVLRETIAMRDWRRD